MNRFVALLAFLFLSASGWADGRVFPPIALPSPVRIPGQRALIQFSNGSERLVIETRFTGAGTNFAWVVPLPAPPVIEEASAGLFPTLQCLFQPRLRHEVPRVFQVFLGLLAGGYLLRFVRRGSPLKCLDVLACLAAGLAVFAPDPSRGFGGFVVFLALIYAVECVRLGVPSLLRLATFFFLIVFLGFLCLPTLSKTAGAGGGAPTATVSILDRRLVGVFETTTVSSRAPAALQAWLKANGFAAPPLADQAIAGYVRDGWVFVAAKIRRDDPALQTATPHPLSFTFKTDNPVYPMRLTGVDNGPVQVDLYVFGPGRAAAPHFQAERCARPVYPNPPPGRGMASLSFSDFSPQPEPLQIVHPLLRKWVDGAPVATKLTASLSPADMRDDVWLSWEPFSAKGTTVFSRQGAWIYAANWGMAVVALCLLAAFVFGPGRENRLRRPARFVAMTGASGIFLAVAIYFLLPKTGVRFVPGYKMPFIEDFHFLGLIHAMATEETNLTDARAMFLPGPGGTTPENFLSGGYIREEDSPGNYQLRQAGGRIECIVYDACGAPSSE